MKKVSICFMFCFLPLLVVFSQNDYSKYSFSGYRVIIVPGETFRMETINKVDFNKEITEDGILKLSIKDQTGRMPKDTVYIYTNKLTYLRLHNSELVMDTPLYGGDSLVVNLAATTGELNVHTRFLSIHAAAGSQLIVKGITNYLDCAIGAASNVDAQNLKANLTELDVRGHSSLKINSEKVVKETVEEGSWENVFHPVER